MDRQHHGHDGFGFGFHFGPGPDADPRGPSARPEGASARPKRWVIHARHGGGGTVASASYGPHVDPDPGR